VKIMNGPLWSPYVSTVKKMKLFSPTCYDTLVKRIRFARPFYIIINDKKIFHFFPVQTPLTSRVSVHRGHGRLYGKK